MQIITIKEKIISAYLKIKMEISCNRRYTILPRWYHVNPLHPCQQTQTLTIDFLSGDQSSSPLATTKRSITLKNFQETYFGIL